MLKVEFGRKNRPHGLPSFSLSQDKAAGVRAHLCSQPVNATPGPLEQGWANQAPLSYSQPLPEV